MVEKAWAGEIAFYGLHTPERGKARRERKLYDERQDEVHDTEFLNTKEAKLDSWARQRRNVFDSFTSKGGSESFEKLFAFIPASFLSFFLASPSASEKHGQAPPQRARTPHKITVLRAMGALVALWPVSTERIYFQSFLFARVSGLVSFAGLQRVVAAGRKYFPPSHCSNLN